jgi:hypothetical protein
MKRIALLELTRNTLAPGWILVFGLILLAAPPLDVTTSLTLLLMGVVVVPALMVIPAGGRRRAPARMTHRIAARSRTS